MILQGGDSVFGAQALGVSLPNEIASACTAFVSGVVESWTEPSRAIRSTALCRVF